MEPYLDLKAVEAYLGSHRVFRDLSLQLHAGQHTAILGPNGAGKSALLKLLTREIHPVVRAGSHLRLFGSERVNLWQLRSRIGLVSMDLQATTRGRIRGADVVLSGFFGSMGIGPSQQVTPEQRQRVGRLMDDLGLSDLAERPYGQLSDGQRRRLLLARALVHQPEVLVLDEPCTALDLRAQHQFLGLLRRLAARGTTLVMVTHRVDALIPEIERCIFLKEGALIGDGPTASMLSSRGLSTLFGTPLQVCSANGYWQVLPA
ncbi:ATP-binding cassette domain-containing protein [Synechococcus sp. RSCCF101]|uniref:ABC transporter ATP-binding protein n=1 Tax=Synechococcus sp. RSCCF101 TaxID=2511069 RepID=UPI001245EE62|nr:ATP-binding cassette domain-containing protein [Synechococcus sp. RSCCF101]QEY31752.1 ATP-binding cassette domain-containing protein [Synechococcus sp. RSCCF101]